ncbi:hypothetical protein RN001_003354 [Aquatica leii]|uniref:Uncharacterized protein n=1 Tax=Aquatica leii TaxID=1421715 RepID=A0AAN7SRK1_9COLE|nr:hypothetical protein RN001_003354 [Aquatica leii]
MSAVLKVLGFLVICVLFNVVLTKPHQKRHQRSDPPQNGYFSEYPVLSNYAPPPVYQPYQQSYQQPYQPQYQQPYQQPYYAMPPPMPIPISNAYYPYFPAYNYYPPMYAPYSIYPPYPYYQPYPYPPQPQNYYPDPYAHIPTEIVDVDSEDSNDDHKTNVEVDSKHHAEAAGQQQIKSTNVVTTKPIQTIITRTFNSSKSEPEIKIQSSNLNVTKLVTGKPDKNAKNADEKEMFSLIVLTTIVNATSIRRERRDNENGFFSDDDLQKLKTTAEPYVTTIYSAEKCSIKLESDCPPNQVKVHGRCRELF